MLFLYHFSTIVFTFLFILYPVKSQNSQNECSNMENGINMCDYISNEELNAKIEELENTYSSNNLVKIGSIGKSVLGEDLTYLKITSNASNDRPLLKPMFK